MGVSIIIPVHNGENTIRQAINSALIQERVELEVVVVNDGSKDGTADILNLYKDNPKVKIITNKENLGLGKTRNIGVENSTYEFITFLDCDDIFINGEAIKEMVSYASVYPSDIIISAQVMLDNKTLFTRVGNKENWTNNDMHGLLIKKDICQKVKFPELRYHEDWAWLTAIKTQPISVKILPVATYLYNLNNSDSLGSNRTMNMYTDLLEAGSYVNMTVLGKVPLEVKYKLYNYITNFIYQYILAFQGSHQDRVQIQNGFEKLRKEIERNIG